MSLNTNPSALNPRRRQLLAALLASPAASWSQSAALPLMLAREAPPDIDPSGFLVSEKFDGVRAHWDGRQLRFRSGGHIQAPAWFTAALPAETLDGELWLGRGQFEPLVSAVRRVVPVDAQWREISYQVFDWPTAPGPFASRSLALQKLLRGHRGPCQAVSQDRIADRAALQRRLDAVLAADGEGLMLHRADALHVPGRSHALLKLKPLHDAEAQVLAHEPGQGKHAGRLGALRVRTAEGIVFLIGTGFSDAQRVSPPAVGSWVTFNHRGKTEAGVPRFASFVRERAL